DEWLDARRETERRVARTDRVDVRGARLVDHVDRPGAFAEGAECHDRRLVQAVGAAAATEDEEAGTRAGRSGTHQVRPYRIPRVQGPSGRKEGQRLREADAHAPGEAHERTVGRARHDVLLEQDGRDAA